MSAATSGARGAVLFLHAKDVVRGAGGAESLVATNVELARRAGFETHLLAAVSRPTARSTDAERRRYGPVTELVNPARRFGRRSTPRSVDVPWLGRPAARSAVRIGAELARRHQGPIVIDACSIWAGPAVSAVEHLRSVGIEAHSVGRFYMTMLDEMRTKRDGITREHGRRARAAAELELAWTHWCQRWEIRGYHRCDVAASNYRSVVDLLQRDYGPRDPIRHGPRTETAVVPYTSGVAPASDTGPARAGSLRDRRDPLRVVVVSRHDPRKGIDIAIRAIASVHRAGVPVVGRLVGGGALLAAHRALVRAEGLEGVVEVTGRVDDVDPHYRWADAFVLPSHEEHSGSLSLIEAARRGCAVVSTAVGGIAEDLSLPDDGVLVPPRDPEAIAAVLTRWATDRVELLRHRRGAAALFARRFDPAVAMEAQSALYRSFGVDPGEGRS